MQPTITNFTFSEDSQSSPNQNNGGNSLHIINPQNLFRPPFVPCTYSFSVTFGVIGVDPSIGHTLEFKLKSPTNDTVISTDKINLQKNTNFDKSLPEEANGFMFNFDFRNVALRKSGKYHGEVIVDDKVVGKFPLLVYSKEN